MGRGTETPAGNGAVLLYGASRRRGVTTPLDRIRDLAGRRPEIAWTYLVELIAKRKLSREDESAAAQAIAAADVERLYAGLENDPSVAHLSEEAWREEREYIEASWPAYLLTSAAAGGPKPTEPERLVFHRPTVGPEGFGPLTVLSMPRPTDEWVLGLSDRQRQTLWASLSGNLEQTPAGSHARALLVEYVIDSQELRSSSTRGIAGRIVWAERIFGNEQSSELGESERDSLQAGVAQDLAISFGQLRETWAGALKRVSGGQGARAATEIFIRRVMHLFDGIEPGRIYAAFASDDRKAIGEAFFRAAPAEFRPFFKGLKLEVERRLAEN